MPNQPFLVFVPHPGMAVVLRKQAANAGIECSRHEQGYQAVVVCALFMSMQMLCGKCSHRHVGYAAKDSDTHACKADGRNRAGLPHELAHPVKELLAALQQPHCIQLQSGSTALCGYFRCSNCAMNLLLKALSICAGV